MPHRNQTGFLFKESVLKPKDINFKDDTVLSLTSTLDRVSSGRFKRHDLKKRRRNSVLYRNRISTNYDAIKSLQHDILEDDVMSENEFDDSYLATAEKKTSNNFDIIKGGIQVDYNLEHQLDPTIRKDIKQQPGISVNDVASLFKTLQTTQNE